MVRHNNTALILVHHKYLLEALQGGGGGGAVLDAVLLRGQSLLRGALHRVHTAQQFRLDRYVSQVKVSRKPIKYL
jgi:hypothetical protein